MSFVLVCVLIVTWEPWLLHNLLSVHDYKVVAAGELFKEEYFHHFPGPVVIRVVVHGKLDAVCGGHFSHSFAPGTMRSTVQSKCCLLPGAN